MAKRLIDSKVSLTAYERGRIKGKMMVWLAIKEHQFDKTSCVEQLGNKNYHVVPNRSPDFVFSITIEPICNGPK
jgi:DNA anti-recombination protein RmuC